MKIGIIEREINTGQTGQLLGMHITARRQPNSEQLNSIRNSNSQFAHFNPIVFYGCQHAGEQWHTRSNWWSPYNRQPATPNFDEFYCRHSVKSNTHTQAHRRTNECSETTPKASRLNYEFIDKWLSWILNRDLIHSIFVCCFFRRLVHGALARERVGHIER